MLICGVKVSHDGVAVIDGQRLLLADVLTPLNVPRTPNLCLLGGCALSIWMKDELNRIKGEASDGTARLQTITPDTKNTNAGRILTHYESLSGIPVLRNTNANLPGNQRRYGRDRRKGSLGCPGLCPCG